MVGRHVNTPFSERDGEDWLCSGERKQRGFGVWSTRSCELRGMASLAMAMAIGGMASLSLRIDCREPTRRESLKVRHRRMRKKLNGTTERPRLAVFRSNKHLYAQVIDDTKQHTLASSSTLKKAVREELEMTAYPTMETAKKVGEEIAKACLEKGITKVAFDRGGFVYHGSIQALADAARDCGLEF